ncbi:MAG: DUF484 family protein [Methyloprofundus sp.]|nr:DUF484 family protein [Methyloprofundus sp.]
MSELEASDVEIFLQDNPKFFNEHLELLEKISIPHPSGNAISLVSKQLELFRNRHHEMENELNILIDIAKNNDDSANKMHELTLAVLEANTLDVAISNLDEVLKECFLTDFFAIKIISEEVIETAMPDVFVNAESEGLAHFVKELASNNSTCGRPTLAQAEFLFGSQALEVQSCAIIPMAFLEIEGIIAIGSRNADRFNRDMGRLFLTQISEIVGTRFISLLKNK